MREDGAGCGRMEEDGEEGRGRGRREEGGGELCPPLPEAASQGLGSRRKEDKHPDMKENEASLWPPARRKAWEGGCRSLS